MKNVQLSDDLYDRLKCFVVDPFDDTFEVIIHRLVDIAEKARDRWCVWEDEEENSPSWESRTSNEESSGFRSKPLSEATSL
jgi:hypothetical protein